MKTKQMIVTVCGKASVTRDIPVTIPDGLGEEESQKAALEAADKVLLDGGEDPYNESGDWKVNYVPPKDIQISTGVRLAVAPPSEADIQATLAPIVPDQA